MKYLLIVGACYLDTILSVPYYPLEDEKLRATATVQRWGGNGFNTLEVLKQLIEGKDNGYDLTLALCSVFPSASSAQVQQIRNSLGSRIDLSFGIFREGYVKAASSYIIRSISAGSRTIVNYNTLPEMHISEFINVVEPLNGKGAWYHFEGRIPDVTLECISHLRRASQSIYISVEVEKFGRPGLEALAAEADVVFYSRSWAQHSGYKDAFTCLQAQALIAQKAFLLCCTWGEDGSSIMELPSGRYKHCPAYRTEELQLMDSTGAGDTFISGMLFSLICTDKWTLEQKLCFATELAGRKVVQEGFSGLGKAMFKDQAENNEDFPLH